LAPTRRSRSSGTTLLSRVTCPNCWSRVPPEEVKWVSAHSDLLGDPLLGENANPRFLPTRFDVTGNAIDVKGEVCHHLACPECHLVVPRALVEMEPLFISILGAPSSGKSYFLASSLWHLQNTLKEQFAVSLLDADPEANAILNSYKATLFQSQHPDQLAELKKTEQEGELYQRVNKGGSTVLYPRPFVFSLQPEVSHQAGEHRRRLSRSLCLYDNAGEHFQPGADTSAHPGTRHLGLSRALLFLYDPTLDTRFRNACKGKTQDLQMGEDSDVYNQDQILLEAARRIRGQTGLASHEKYPRPLIVVVTKYDAWYSLAGDKRLRTRWVIKPGETTASLAVDALQNLSDQVRSILVKHSPEIVTTAEGLSSDVTYIPVSALGCTPELNPKTGRLAVRPSKMKPMWPQVPMLYALHRAASGLIPARKPSKAAAAQRASSRDGEDDVTPRIMRETGS